MYAIALHVLLFRLSANSIYDPVTVLTDIYRYTYRIFIYIHALHHADMCV